MRVDYAANWTMDQLAITCSTKEKESLGQLTGLSANGQSWNTATYEEMAVVDYLKNLVIVAKGKKPNGTARYLFSAKINVERLLTDVDVYRWI